MAKSGKHDSYPILEFTDSLQFEKWLNKNHSSTDGIWLKFAKKDSGIKSVNYAEAVEVALCYGWIDGLARRVDENYYVQKFTPRRSNSLWSQINKKKVAVLIREKKMQEPGLAAIEEAKKNGRWKSAYASPSAAKLPAEFTKALKNNVKAKKFFDKLSATNRYAIIHRLTNVKKEETRLKKIEQYIAMLERNETIHP